MDPLTRLLIRMAMLLRRPPSRRQLITMAVVLAVSLAIAGYERGFGWPDWLSAEPVPIRRN